MKVYVIRIENHDVSMKGAKALIQSSKDVKNEFDISVFKAITPENVDQVIKEENIEWNWPHTGVVLDPVTGLRKHGYGGRDPKRRKACGMSHYLLWKKCFENDESLLILEHDAVFISKIDLSKMESSHYDIIGINSPIGATRLASTYDAIVQNSNEFILPVPTIDKPTIPQGIAGNSAYIIKPRGAKKLLDLVSKYGMWNNDAILCQQLMPNMIGQTKTYYTTVQKLSSTTMG